VGLLALACARLIGVERLIAIDQVPFRLQLAADKLGAEVIDHSKEDVYQVLRELTAGRGPDVCIDAVGLEAQGHGFFGAYDRVKQFLRLESDRPTALRQIIRACAKGGVVSIPGVYAGFADKFPIGAAFGKGLTMTGGQTHVQRYMAPLLQRITDQSFDPSFIITHRLPLSDAATGYRTFLEDRNACVKVVLTPDGRPTSLAS
jgi:threonine dehydrogenase-like Zn-dependent dehydrogenase